jgi:hypothetical protein
MSIVTVWTNPSFAVQLVQLSDDPADGTAQEQIAHLSTLSYLDGWSCVDPDFTGSVPAGDASQWRWSDGQIVYVPAVPASVTPRQVRLLLLSQNLLSQVEAIIAASDEATKITWSYASEFRRNDPLLLALAGQLGLTSEQVDEFFIAAAAI